MTNLKEKTVVIGICGGIAVYKICDVVSMLKKQGINVYILMTKNATKFVHPNTFQTLSKNHVITEVFCNEENPKEVMHIALAKKADLFVVAPATANMIGKIANGIADDIVSTTILPCTKDKLIVPAMNTYMYKNAIVQDNLTKLKRFGYNIMEPNTGLLACGDIGDGKLPTPQKIVDTIITILEEQLDEKIEKDLVGKKILITAGATRESLDPVRYITNHSTGKMGYAIAKNAIKRGATVTLVSGKTNLEKPNELHKYIEFTSANDLLEIMKKEFNDNDIIIQSAAVADYTPKAYSDKKIKKADDDLVIRLKRTVDVAKELGKIKGDKILVGFAAETDDLIENAKRKIESKNLDYIVANKITENGAGFGSNTNIVKIINKQGQISPYPILSKTKVADIILNTIVK